MDLLGDEKRVFGENRIFQYNRARKTAFGLVLIIGGALLVSFAFFYYFVLKNSDFFLIEMMNSLVSSIMTNIRDSTLLGVFYTSAIGGLFFIFMPIEVFFARFLSAGNPVVPVFVIFLLGTTMSYTINYLVGLKLSRLSRKIISPKQFYGLKGKLNRYGGLAIFMFNALPLPSQPFAAILGVFRYNKTRFYFYVLLGQLVKGIVIALGVYGVF